MESIFRYIEREKLDQLTVLDDYSDSGLVTAGPAPGSFCIRSEV